MDALIKAKTLLEQEGHTLVLCLDDTVHTSQRRGVAPLLALLEQKTPVAGFAAADKVVGRATAFLYGLLGVSRVYGRVMSQPALAVLEKHGIEAHYEQLVPHIVNRQGTGICPMEQATAGIEDPQEALAAVKAALDRLKA